MWIIPEFMLLRFKTAQEQGREKEIKKNITNDFWTYKISPLRAPRDQR